MLPFADYLRTVSPNWQWDWPHLTLMQRTLGEVLAGRCRKVMFFLPPRHGKTEQNTVRFAGYCLERDPSARVIIWAYNQTLACKFSRKIRRIVSGRVPLSTERTAAEEWETLREGGVRAAGVGTGISGMGANLIIVDDPVKNREEAESVAYQERVWESYSDDLYTRLEPGGSIVLTMTRWHEADLAGRILESEDGPNWTVVRLPALAETQEERDFWAERMHQPLGLPDPLGRAPGVALCPDRYSASDLDGIRRVLLSGFSALYQQAPGESEGTLFRREWFQIVNAVPAGSRFVRYWDKAGTEGGGAYSAGVLMARGPDGSYYVVDVVRGQWSAGGREKMILQTAELDGTHVDVWTEQEPGSGGKESAEATVKNLAGFNAHREPVTGDKVSRARPLAAQAEVGNVRLVRGAWNRAWLDEASLFPSGRYKDQIDASSGAFNKLALAAKPSRSQASGTRPQLSIFPATGGMPPGHVGPIPGTTIPGRAVNAR